MKTKHDQRGRDADNEIKEKARRIGWREEIHKEGRKEKKRTEDDRDTEQDEAQPE